MGLDFIGKLRLRLWYMLCVHQLSTAIVHFGNSSNAATAFDAKRLTSGVVRDVVRWLAVSQAGFHTNKFDERWIADNNLVGGTSLLLTREAAGLIQTSIPEDLPSAVEEEAPLGQRTRSTAEGAATQRQSPTSADDRSAPTARDPNTASRSAPSAQHYTDGRTGSDAAEHETQQRSSHPPPPLPHGNAEESRATAVAGSDGAARAIAAGGGIDECLTMEAPETQVWSDPKVKAKTTCICCRKKKSRVETTTGLCPICFRRRTGTQPNLTAQSLAKGTCENCGALGDCGQADANQVWPGKLVGDPCWCCKKTAPAWWSATQSCVEVASAHIRAGSHADEWNDEHKHLTVP